MPPRKTTEQRADERAVATRPTTALAGFSPDQVQLIKDTVAKGTSDSELAFFLEVAKATGLNPFKRQIHAVMRYDRRAGRDVMAIQTGIDGYRKLAEDSGLYMPGPIEWCGQDGAWTEVWLRDVPPAAARATVYRSDMRDENSALMPIRATALWKSYVQTTSDGGANHMWRQHGPLMLGKCAEALAIRRAFPDRTSALYTDDEMGQADVPTEPERRPPADQGRGPSSSLPSGVATKVAAASAAAPTPMAAGPQTEVRKVDAGASTYAVTKPNGEPITERSGIIDTRPIVAAVEEKLAKAADQADVAYGGEAHGTVGDPLGPSPLSEALATKGPPNQMAVETLVSLGRAADESARSHFYTRWLPEHGYEAPTPTARWKRFVEEGAPHIVEALHYFEQNSKAAPA